MAGNVTTLTLQKKKANGEKITSLTAYDFSTARTLDEAGIDFILVGDSLGMVVLGYENTIPVTLEDMIHHTRAVARGAHRAMVVADMPFLSYHVSIEEAVRNAGRLIQEGGAHAVKIEGGRPVVDTVKRMVDAGIPVLCHLGMTPQSVYKFGGFRVQGRQETDAERILSDAHDLQSAGAFGVVLELIPADLAKVVTESLDIPTIGIGAGRHCDGQVLISDDMLGIYTDLQPKHNKKYADLHVTMRTAFEEYIKEVKEGSFPGLEHSF
ncbi:MAG TPA: 3-methyl-2-oxobutanoate hydroxymethyltransferase [Armatimonadota bacterium]|jgi:3-methyl-2-oxobutanoate hydroxymethyltransferase